MAHLHELLAVEADRKKTAELLLEEAKQTFKSRADHFTSLRKEYKPDDEKEAALEQPAEVKPMVEEVWRKLEHVAESQIVIMDLLYQKELANGNARADLVLPNGECLQRNVPATVLLALETRLKALREMILEVPTLPPGEEWEEQEDGHFRVVEKRVRTAKTMKNHVVAAATDKHPAQVQVYQTDERVGLSTTIKITSVLDVGDKSRLLGRLDTLQQAVKQARQRANTAEVPDAHIGARLFEFLYTGAPKALQQP